MSDHQHDHSSEASGSRPRSPSSTAHDDVARLESDLIPSPPASSHGLSASDPSSAAVSSANVDGSARVYRFPSDLPPRFAGSSADPDPNERVVTVRDLRSKSCWICSEDDEDPMPSQGQGLSGEAPATPSTRPKRFVHPCNCTLVAHESCLLRWIDQSKRNHPLQNQVTCPQCKAPYILINNKTTLLKIFEFFDKLVTRIEPIGAFSILGGSVLVACTAYGSVAIRMVLGKDAARRALASPWPWHYWVDIPLIPFALIASRLNIFESAMTWVPTIVAFPITSIPMATATAAHGRLFDRYLESSIFSARSYPPGPALTALLVPWIRVFYLALKRKVYRAVLGPFYGSRRSGSSRRTTGTGRNRRRVVIVGEADSYLVDGDAALGAQPMPDGIGGPMAQVQQDGNGDDEGDDGPMQTVYVSHHSLARLCLGALSLPFVANVMGRILGYFARFSPLLARFLGMKNVQPPSSSMLSSFYTTKATPTTSSKAASESPSPIASLFRGQLPLFDSQTIDGKKNVANDANKSFSERLTLLGYSPRYDDLDPVWFRNAVGAAVFIVVKDAGSLLYRRLRLSQRDRTSIKDLPFQAGLVSGLDLRS
ncbi:hypothetical protein PHSY_006275 [Pseudozyma hubeiensis SY62]|uniref:RING-CH-type domain-containing protein n=1 Tax=Pseudozyma hubeiensis (strain SY62) TaxID=1305764 RepID=R9PBC7_PSEHS|nr:hypothetical protein PHSY_006275 [Pseudozyma hubeiensis SY62]GAC98681.1 hypothetical protein PHSY_006275 [Pseudozyma hubeiensis SY62]